MRVSREVPDGVEIDEQIKWSVKKYQVGGKTYYCPGVRKYDKKGDLVGEIWFGAGSLSRAEAMAQVPNAYICFREVVLTALAGRAISFDFEADQATAEKFQLYMTDSQGRPS